MLFGSTPMLVLVLAPFALLARTSLELASDAWSAFSVTLLCFAILLIARNLPPKREERWLGYLLIACSVGSSAFTRNLYLGQTAIFAMAILLLLYCAMRSGEAERRSWLYALLLTALAIKPPYFALGLIIALLEGRFRLALYAIGCTCAIFVAFMFPLGALWPVDYLETLSIYTQEEIPQVFRSALVFDNMNLFRNVGIISAQAANTVSYVLMLVTFGAATTWALAARRFVSTSRNAEDSATIRAKIFIAVLGSYLLFAPYAGIYEDFLLPLGPAIAWSERFLPGQDHILSFRTISILALLIVLLNHTLFLPEVPMAALWVAKVTLFAILLFGGGSREGRASRRGCRVPGTS